MRKNIKRIALMTVAIFIISLNSVVSVKADTTIIPYKEAYGTKCVNIVDLAKAMKAEIKQNGEGLEIFLNGKGLTVYPTHKYVYVNGKLTPLKTEKVKDYESGTEFNFPVGQTPTKDGEGYLIPISILEEHFGIKGTENGVEISDGNQNQGGDNSDGGNNSGGDTSNGGSNSGGGNSNGGGSSSGGGNSSGGGTNPTPPPTGGGGETTPPKPPTPPTPPPVDPPKPPEPPKPSGLSPSQIESRLPGIGLTYDASSSGYGINVYTGDNILVSNDNNAVIGFSAFKRTASNSPQMKQILNWALPTAGDEIYNIIINPFSSKTLQRDGKTVKLFSDSNGISVDIYY